LAKFLNATKTHCKSKPLIQSRAQTHRHALDRQRFRRYAIISLYGENWSYISGYCHFYL